MHQDPTEKAEHSEKLGGEGKKGEEREEARGRNTGHARGLLSANEKEEGEGRRRKAKEEKTEKGGRRYG